MNWEKLEQLRALRGMNPARVAARREADYALDEKYAGHRVAYIDRWDGDRLERTVVAAATDSQTFYDLLDQLPADVRGRVEYAEFPESGVIECPSVWLE